MDELNTNTVSLDKTQGSKVTSKRVFRDKFARKISRFATAVRIFLFIGLVLWICMPNVIEPAGVAFLVLAAVLAILFIISRVIVSYNKQLSRLGCVTEVCFVVGIIFVLLDLWWGSGHLLLAGFSFSFGLAPLLGIINRLLLVTHKQTKSTRNTIGEIIILSISVIIVTWLLLCVHLPDTYH